MTTPHEISTAVTLNQADVLIVDDDPDIREMTRCVLEDEGYGVATASNGTEALAHITEHQPALVLLDIRMPGVSGFEVQERLHELGLSVTVVFMSAEPQLASRVRQYHAAGFLQKPFDLSQFLDVVERFTPQPHA
jgi:two-component system response regulator (stage 0 sporulation protein F)